MGLQLMMKEDKVILLFSVLGILLSIGITIHVMAIPVINGTVGTIPPVSGDRKAFSFCPTFPVITANNATYTVESCPKDRLYVNHWSTLNTVNQQNILTNLQSLGWNETNQ